MALTLKTFSVLLYALCFTHLAPIAAFGQPSTPSAPTFTGAEQREGITVYEPEFFTPYRPTHAKDMLDRIPGAANAISNAGGGNLAGDDDRRGLRSQTTQVLINGKRLPVPDLDAVLERVTEAGLEVASEMQILFLEPYGAVRAFAVKTPGGSGQWLTLFEPGASPMTKTELVDFLEPGRFGEWVRFNNLMTGTIHYKKGGDARVTWADGLNEEGTWTIKGDAICTAWYRLRDFRELCVEHYRTGESSTQSFRIGAGPDGLTHFGPPDN